MYRAVFLIQPFISEIESLRHKLIEIGFDKFIQNSIGFIHNYGNLHLEALKVWNNNFESNTIISTNHNLRFVLNVKY